MTDFDLLKKEIKNAFPDEKISDKELASMAWELVDFFTMAAKAYKTEKKQKITAYFQFNTR